MLGIGMQEILIILGVALIVIGPKRLPELARTLGKGLAEFRKAADDFQETIRRDLEQEKHDEFRQKHPDLVPEEDQETSFPSADGTGEKESAGRAADSPGQSVPPDPEPVTSDNPPDTPEAEERKDNTKDDTRDG